MSRSRPSVPGPRPVESEAQGEWDQCRSPRRIYAALNEIMPSDALEEILRDFFRRLAVPRRCLILIRQDEKTMYEGFIFAIFGDDDNEPMVIDEERVEARARAWAAYVKRRFPEPPPGFVFVGNTLNQPKSIPLPPSPHLDPEAPHRVLNPAKAR